ncbi:MAG TPA: hypothetical protein VIK15_01910 [Candidatus Anoxymicrobiaceae bacterium]|jgi:hypothetical protein
MGRAFFNGYMTRTRLVETRRPLLVKLLAASAAASGLLLVAEGILVGWFPAHVAPFFWDLDFFNGRAPWITYPQWLAGASVILIGLAGVFAGVMLVRRAQTGVYFTLFLFAGLLVAGVVMLTGGLKYSGPWVTTFGAVNIGVMLLLAVLLGLAWYTLDPLGLHGEPRLWSP